MDKKVKKKKIRFKGIIVIILILYLVGNIFYYLWKMPIKNIYITGNFYLKDNYLINYLELNNESIIQVSKKSIANKLLAIDLISEVKIQKNYFGILYIDIKEDKVLFYNWNTKKAVLSSGKEVDYSSDYLGIPTLINYVKNDVYEDLVVKLNRISIDVLKLISEIEYSPSEVNGKIVDEKRFLFRMNDGNIVYINIPNIEKINNYLEIYEGIVNKNGYVKGCLYLDSISENIHFNLCKEAEKEEIINES